MLLEETIDKQTVRDRSPDKSYNTSAITLTNLNHGQQDTRKMSIEEVVSPHHRSRMNPRAISGTWINIEKDIMVQYYNQNSSVNNEIEEKEKEEEEQNFKVNCLSIPSDSLINITLVSPPSCPPCE